MGRDTDLPYTLIPRTGHEQYIIFLNKNYIIVMLTLCVCPCNAEMEIKSFETCVPPTCHLIRHCPCNMVSFAQIFIHHPCFPPYRINTPVQLRALPASYCRLPWGNMTVPAGLLESEDGRSRRPCNQLLPALTREHRSTLDIYIHSTQSGNNRLYSAVTVAKQSNGGR